MQAMTDFRLRNRGFRDELEWFPNREWPVLLSVLMGVSARDPRAEGG